MSREVFSGVKDKTNFIILTGEKITAQKQKIAAARVKCFDCVLIYRLYFLNAIESFEFSEVGIRFDEHHIVVLAGLIVDEAGSLLSRADARLDCGSLVFLIV